MLTPTDQVPQANADLLDVDALAADLDKLCKLHAGHERELRTALAQRLKAALMEGRGAADRSYGIQVAKLAGLPASVIERAKLVLAKLEAEDRASPRGFDDLPLFAATSPLTPAKREIDDALAEVVSALAAINPDELSPREALEALYRLKAARDAGKG